MTLEVAVVVEGKGETVAVPLLLCRIAGAATCGLNLRISVLRQGRQQMVKRPHLKPLATY